MMKIAFAAATATAVLTGAPLLVGTIPAEAQDLKVAQVDVQIGRDRYRDDFDRRRRDSDVTVGVGPGGVTVGPRRDCRMVTTTVERPDGRSITRRERRCD
jgi:hypothetical protein